jgi:hypothetical protein
MLILLLMMTTVTSAFSPLCNNLTDTAEIASLKAIVVFPPLDCSSAGIECRLDTIGDGQCHVVSMSGVDIMYFNSGLERISFPALSSANLTSVSALQSDALVAVSFPVLRTLHFAGSNNIGLVGIAFHRCPLLRSLSFPLLTSITGTSGIFIKNCPKCASIAMQSLSSIDLTPTDPPLYDSFGITIIGLSPLLKSLSFPKLNSVHNPSKYGSSLLLANNPVEALHFPLLQSVIGSFQVANNSNLVSLEFPALEILSNRKDGPIISVFFGNNPLVQSMTFPNLRSIIGGDAFFEGLTLQYLSFPALTSVVSPFTFAFNIAVMNGGCIDLSAVTQFEEYSGSEISGGIGTPSAALEANFNITSITLDNVIVYRNVSGCK